MSDTKTLWGIPLPLKSEFDEQLGRRLRDQWVADVAEKNGIPVDAIPPEFAAAVVATLPQAEAESALSSTVEKALHKAAVGDFETAGRLIREDMHAGAQAIADSNMVGRLCTDIRRMKPDAKLGGHVRAGSKKPRRDNLRRLMEDTYAALCSNGGTPTWREVLDALLEHDNPDEFKRDVQEIDEEAEEIRWCDRRGKEQSTSFAAFRDRLTEIRKTRL